MDNETFHSCTNWWTRPLLHATLHSPGQQEKGRGEAALVKLQALDHNLVPFPFFQTIFCFLINPINRPKSFVCIHFVNCSQN